MGVVYRARQTEPVNRVVALKVLQAGAVSEEVLARFESERQALAVMDHPFVAKIFDAGVSDDGRSYFAMELVEGPSITEYCDAHRLTIERRLRLFADVCRAVQHAHQKGLIHRDLKPSNILVEDVDGQPHPKVIDFGIAKSMEPDSFDGSRLTREDQIIGTPAYMSPEQIDGLHDVDTRSDVYALGIVLYELLAGALPYDRTAYRGWSAVAASLHREMPTASRRFESLADTQETVARARAVSAPRLRKLLRGDLDFVVARATDPVPEERYETALGLALDIERYLGQEPVRAAAGGRAYRVRKFVRRNRLPVAFGAAAILALVGFSTSTAIQARRIAAARDVADARRAQAEDLIDFMLTDLRERLVGVGRLDILDGIGEQATRYFASMPPEELSDDELLRRSQALYQIGSVRLDQGRSSEAGAAFAESLRLAQALSGRAPTDADRLFALSQSYFWVGYAEWLDNDLDGAEREFLGYLETAERLRALDPENLDYQMEVGYAHSNLGSVREERGDFTGAAMAYEQGLEIAERKARRDSLDVDALGEWAESHNVLAVVYRRQGRYEDALTQHQAELSIKEDLLRIDPNHRYWQRRLAWALNFLGMLESELGRPVDAVGSFDQAVERMDRLLSEDETNFGVLRSTGIVRMARGSAHASLERLAEARRDHDEAVTRLRAVAASPDAPAGWKLDVAKALAARSRTSARAGQYEAAVRDAREALEIADAQASGPDVTSVLADAWTALGLALLETDSAGSREAAARAVQLLEPLAGAPGGFPHRPRLTEAYLLVGLHEKAAEQLAVLREAGHAERSLDALATALGGPS